MSEKVLIIDGGGRGHALAYKLAQSPLIGEIIGAPGNPGIDDIGRSVSIDTQDVEALATLAVKEDIDFVVVGTERALAAGVTNRLQAEGVEVFGPSREAACLEWSKALFAEAIRRWGVPSPESKICVWPEIALNELQVRGPENSVIKPDGLTDGKGVSLPKDFAEAQATIQSLMIDRSLGNAGRSVIIQERLEGQELSAMALCDGQRGIMLPHTRDYKRLMDGDKGPNTGGMGAYGPVEIPADLETAIQKNILEPILSGMASEGKPFHGIMYLGLILTADGPKLIEINTRFGDPECQVLMMLIAEDLYPLLKQSVRGELSDQALKIRDGHAVSVALAAQGYPDQPKIGDEIFGLQDIGPDVEIFHAGTRRKNQRLLTNGGRVLHVASFAETLTLARKNVYQAIGKQAIHFKGMQYREEIGT